MSYKQREYLRNYLRAWKLANKDKVRLYAKKYSLKNKEKARLRSRKHYLAHKVEISLRRRLRRQTPEGRMSIKTRDALRKNRIRDLSRAIIQQVYEDNIKLHGTLTCYLCLKPIEFGQDSLDHKIPLSRGGINVKDNLDIAHGNCNSRKHTKTEAEFRETFPLRQSSHPATIF